MKRVLVFAPHPDDDVIGCGGSMAKHIANGNSVAVVFMTSGDIGSLSYSPAEIVAIREGEARKAGEFLGVSAVHFFKNPDGHLHCSWENLIRITSLLRDYRPHIVYIPHKHDRHRDHRITHSLVVEACMWSGSPRAQECGCRPWNIDVVLCYEVGTPLTEVNYVEDISDFFAVKVEAVRLHASQTANREYDEAVGGLNRFRGITTGRGKYCECFQIITADKLF